MSKKHPGLTIKEHEELGRKLAAMREELVNIAVLVGSAYPISTGIYKHACRAYDEIDHLRSILDNFVYIEHGYELRENGQDPTRVYYPTHEESK